MPCSEGRFCESDTETQTPFECAFLTCDQQSKYSWGYKYCARGSPQEIVGLTNASGTSIYNLLPDIR